MKRPTSGEFEAAGLYDPADPNAPERLELLEFLVGIGATLDDLVANAETLAVVPTQILLFPDRKRFTLEESAEKSGLPRRMVARLWIAAGFPEPAPEDRIFTTGDVAMLEVFSAGVELFGEDLTIQMTRVLGAAAAKVADASVSAFMVNVGSLSGDDESGLVLAKANAAAMPMITSAVEVFDTLLRHQVELARRPIPEPGREASGYESMQRTVGFVDLVGSTALARELSPSEYAAALSEFDAIASETVVAHGGRVVKLIGDEVMFVAEPDAAARIACALVAAFEHHEVLPPVRGGLASGEVLSAGGDYFGPVVNLAARVVKLADPSSVVVTGETRTSLQGNTDFAFADRGSHRLKGFGEAVRLFVVSAN